MLKSICIGIILFSASISFGQNSKTQAKDVPPTVSTSENGVGTNTKANLQEEYAGTKPNGPHPDSLKIMVYDPLNEEKDRKIRSTDKNTSKPH